MRKVMPFVLTMVIVSWSSISRADVQSNSCASALPADVQQRLQIAYKDWSVLKISDLVEDDQQLWVKAHGQDCPGAIAGHFVDDKSTSYAVLLIKSDAAGKESKLLLISASNIKELYTEHHVANNPVVYKGEPGEYQDVYGSSKAVTAKLDVPIYEHIEASAIAFVYKNGKYHQVLISD